MAKILILLCCVAQIYGIYRPVGEEVIAGEVLLPASRRGRYLADIIRRQAVDGTQIKFNKDADRLNAEAKKHIDALSEELLPYVTAEQERRIALHKRVMMAIQTGEHGVTIAEARGRPPVIIQRGKLYRCPMKFAPLEPDGTGLIMCENGIRPKPIVFDACLDAEDEQLYLNNDTYYFFCNRHRDRRLTTAELPRNDTHEFSCHPRESTSRDYTLKECTPEETGDVVLHYRYYPDKGYKSVHDLDPDGEMCDNWYPCQIGYIYSLASLESAKPAIGFFDSDPNDFNYEEDEFIPDPTEPPIVTPTEGEELPTPPPSEEESEEVPTENEEVTDPPDDEGTPQDTNGTDTAGDTNTDPPDNTGGPDASQQGPDASQQGPGGSPNASQQDPGESPDASQQGPGGSPNASQQDAGESPDGSQQGPGGSPDASQQGPGGSPDASQQDPGESPDASQQGPGGNADENPSRK